MHFQTELFVLNRHTPLFALMNIQKFDFNSDFSWLLYLQYVSLHTNYVLVLLNANISDFLHFYHVFTYIWIQNPLHFSPAPFFTFSNIPKSLQHIFTYIYFCALSSGDLFTNISQLYRFTHKFFTKFHQIAVIRTQN